MGPIVRYLWVLPALFASALGDTPANCSYEDIRGTWTFQEGQRSAGSDLDCTDFRGPIFFPLKLELLFPNDVMDENGNRGTWTMIYNQGFEVIIKYRKYYAFSMYEDDGNGNVVSRCGEVLPGWSHDVLGKNWACYTAQKNTKVESKVHQEKKLIRSSKRMKQNSEFVSLINKVQQSWIATTYPELNDITLEDLVRRSGGLSSRIYRPPPPAPVSPYQEKMASQMPEEFDWRNVGGHNFVSPVRDQGNCGSCYAFASMGMLEARLRISTNNQLKVIFSPQDVLGCSQYSQGCEGGFPYLVAGKYAQDFGVVPEDCYPYLGKDSTCPEDDCKRFYVADYGYVGGYYGACNEAAMKVELVNNGPIAVGFEVYTDFGYYRSGIYHHTGLTDRDRFNPFYEVNHGVLVTGYGVDNKTGEKYWIVKNSWGAGWGDNGYFKIRRGTNECGIESVAVRANPIP